MFDDVDQYVLHIMLVVLDDGIDDEIDGLIMREFLLEVDDELMLGQVEILYIIEELLLAEADDDDVIQAVQLCADEPDDEPIDVNDEHIVHDLDEIDELKHLDEVIANLAIWLLEVSDKVDIKQIILLDITELEVDDDGIDDELEVQ